MQADTERQRRFLELIGAHQGVLRKLSALYARDRADREDLFQEILLQLWRAFPSFRGTAAFSTFLYRVALNTAVTRLRRAGRRPAVEAERELEAIAAPAAVREDEQVERLYSSIRKLGAVDRALVLLVLEERPQAEIAEIIGLAVGNVSVRLSRARERLRQMLSTRPAPDEEKPCSTRS